MACRYDVFVAIIVCLIISLMVASSRASSVKQAVEAPDDCEQTKPPPPPPPQEQEKPEYPQNDPVNKMFLETVMLLFNENASIYQCGRNGVWDVAMQTGNFSDYINCVTSQTAVTCEIALAAETTVEEISESISDAFNSIFTKKCLLSKVTEPCPKPSSPLPKDGIAVAPEQLIAINDYCGFLSCAFDAIKASEITADSIPEECEEAVFALEGVFNIYSLQLQCDT